MARKSIYNQTIALAGLAQAVYLIKQLARHGTADADAIEASIGSIMKIEASDIKDVYGGLNRIRTGVRQLEKQLSGPPAMDPEQLNYAGALLFLERKLVSNDDLLLKLRRGLEQIGSESNADEDSETIISRLADLYQSTVSQLNPKILVNGEQVHLTNPDNVIKIRALLLAGIRSAFLWRQYGGSRWRFVLFRKRMLHESKKLLETV
ncbi:MAG: high frequency lysogenization protein HflD [Methylococcales bacterium]|nr:high frequency lysogenization protein HflD [Methylococcales bacterium]